MTTEQTNQFIKNISTSLDKDTTENVVISKLCSDIFENYVEMPTKPYLAMLASIASEESNNTYTRLMAVLMTHYEVLKMAMVNKNDNIKSNILNKMQSILYKIDAIGQNN